MKIKYKLTFAVILSYYSVLIAQVGISNSSPLQTLHISGIGTGTAQPIIRIDGLNSTQNTAHENAASLKRVFATSNGDLVILNNNQTNKFYTSPAFPVTAVPGGTERAVVSYAFTLDYPSVVHVEARMGSTVTSDIANTASLKNGQARSFGGYYKFTSAPSGVATNVAFGESSMSHSTSTGTNQLNGVFYFEPRKDLYLPKGNYTIVLYGFSGDASMAFSINSIAQTSQLMRVSITPVTY